MADTKMKALILTFLLIIVGLALTPAVASFIIDATYQNSYEEKLLTPSSSNTTTVTYNIRDTDEAYMTIVALNQTSANKTIASTEYSYTVSGAKTILITNIVSDKGSAGHVYYLLITYQTIDLTDAVIIALAPIVSLLWVVIVLAVGVVAIYEQLKRTH